MIILGLWALKVGSVDQEFDDTLVLSFVGQSR